MDEEFPFGEEEEFSKQKLLQFVQNAVAVGQWEIAKACFHVCAREFPREKGQLQSLLLEIFLNPKKMCYGSKTIPSPYHLSWLALQLLVEIYGKEAESLLHATGRAELDFKIFLLSLSPAVNAKILEECYSCFKMGLKKQQSNVKAERYEKPSKMSKELQYHISEFAISDLRNCRALTDFLVSSEQHEQVVQERRDDIANSYMRVLLSYIGRLQLFTEGVQTMLLGECLFILTAAKVYFDADSRMFCETIISLAKILMETDSQAIKLLYSCLIDHDSLPFLKLAMETSWSIKLKKLGLTDNTSIENMEEHQNVRIAGLLSGSLARKDSYALFTSFQICNYYEVHLLECIINASLYLIERGSNEAALDLLKPALLCPLKPLILLLAWPKCETFNEAENLLVMLWKNKDYQTEPVLEAACKRLQYNLEVSNLCSGDLKESKSSRDQGMKPMFQELAFDSILQVLNKMSLIERLEQEEITKILENQPADDHNTVHQVSEVVVYSCFRILQKSLRSYLKDYNVTEDFNVEATDKYQGIRELLCKIYPLSLRLELLENLFSLLFIRQEDLSVPVLKSSTDGSDTSMQPDVFSAGSLFSPNSEEADDASLSRDTSFVSDASEHLLSSKHRPGSASDGFIFEENSVKEFLEMLNDSLIKLSAEKFAETTKGELSLESPEVVQNLVQRSSLLSQSVKEALWRLQLVSGFDQGDDLDSCKDGREEEEISAPEVMASSSNAPRKAAAHEKHLVSQMLSSPDSLVHLCLRKGSPVQAKQVIKMFNLYGTPCAWEIEFAECFSDTLKQLKDKTLEPVESTQSTKVSHLSTIKSVAAAGVFSSSVRSVVDKLLLHPYITSGKQDRITSGKGEEITSGKQDEITSGKGDDPLDFSAVAVCSDLAVSGELGSNVCKTIIDMTGSLMKELVEETDLSSNLSASINRLKSLINLYSRIESNTTRNEFDSNPYSVSDFLRQGYRYMHAESIEQDFQTISKQRESFHQINEFITAQEVISTALSEDRGSDVSRCRKYMNENLSSFSVEKLVFQAEAAPKRDYIKTLFRHIDTLARLQLHCKNSHNVTKSGQQSSLGNIKAVNPFIVLKEDISEIFRRLLFKWNMSAKRLESVAKQVNIKIVNVVARNFGLSFPVKRNETYTDLTAFLVTRPRILLNDFENGMEACDSPTSPQSLSDVSDPTTVMEYLLDRLLKLIADLPPSYESHVGSKEITNLASSTKFLSFAQDTCMLKNVDLSLLQSEDERLCFMVNLYNLMLTHGVLVLLGGSIDLLPQPEKTDLYNWSYESLMEKPVGRLALHQFSSYQVGGIGVLSAFDLYRHILLGGTSTTFYGEALKAGHDLFEWTAEHLAHSPSKQEKRSLFLLSHGSTGCPPFKVLKPSTLEEQLKNSTKNFLERTVHVEPSGLKVTLPKMILWYRGLFMPRQPLTSDLRTASSIDFKDRDSALLQFILNMSSKLRDQFKRVSYENLSIIYSDHNWSLNLNHDISVTKKRPSTVSKRLGDYQHRGNGKPILSEPIREYLAEASPVASALIVMALEQKQLIDHVDIMIMEARYNKRIGNNPKTSLVDLIEKGISNMRQSVKKSKALKAFLTERFAVFIKTIGNLRYNEKMTSESYLESFQALVKNWLCCINPFNPTDIQYTNVLPQLINFFTSFGWFEISPLVTEQPQALPVVLKDSLVCECIMEINDRLNDLFEASLSLSEGGVQFDIDRIELLTSELKHCLLLVEDPYLKCQAALQSVSFLDASDASDILEICAEDCSEVDSLVEKLNGEAAKIRWYQQILNLILNPDSSLSSPIAVAKWQDIVELAQMYPDYISVLLVATESYDLVNFWIQNFSVPHKLSKLCLHAKLHDLLKHPFADYMSLYAELQHLQNKHMTLEICQDMLANPEIASRQTLLLIQYMDENLTHLLDRSQILDLLYRRLGVTALENFPESLKSSYRHLTCKPVLILEQLLMNMKLELAIGVLESLRASIKDQEDLKPLLTQFDDVIVAYAKLSLEVPLVEMVSQSEAKSTGLERRKMSRKHTRNESYSKSQFQASSLEDRSTAGGSLKDKVVQEIVAEKTTVQCPVMPVERKMWTTDKSVSVCMVCDVQTFNTFNRRHHCRHCGRVTCADCSNHRSAVTGYPGKVRVCDQCFEQIYSSDRSLHDKEKEHLAHLTVESRPASPSSPNTNMAGSTTNESRENSALNINIQEINLAEWQLTINDEKNDEIRSDFYFDQAPSASLCISIVDLYSDAQKSGGMLLKFCNDLSKHLNESNRVDSADYHDIDNSMVVGMIEFLLFNAKVKFMKAGDINGVELCDSYIAHVEVLKLLLNSDWQEIPTMQELSHPEIIRRLRDRLVDSERYSLAIDVTGKCGLDASTVWFAWGISLLKSGDIICAREHFAKCLTPVKSEGSKALQQNAYYLTQIVEIIEYSPLLSYAMDEELLSPLICLQEQSKPSVTGCLLDRRRYDEILYYLKTYGSHTQVVKFYVRQGLHKKAAIYIKDRKCSEDVFIEDLVLRSFQDGTFEDLTKELKDIDPTLSSWKNYLTKACHFFDRKGLSSCLYEMQRLMKDHFRAATTCIRFFLGTSGNPAKSFKELRNRLSHLDTAKMHLEALLKERAAVRMTFVSHVGSFLGDDKPAILMQEVSTSDVKNHLNTIDLQVKVLDFIQDKCKNTDTEVKGKVPTLFGNGKERGELVSKLLIISLQDSFPLVSRIIQDYHLPVSAVFGNCIDKLAMLRHYDVIVDLMKNIEATGMMADKARDDLLLQVIRKITEQGGQNVRQANSFIKMIRNDSKKVNGLIICGRLKDAYIESLKGERVNEIERILLEAKRVNQRHVVDICQKYLANYKEKQERKARLR